MVAVGPAHELKVCGRCKQAKPIDAFYRARNGKRQLGLVVKSACKVCQIERVKQWQRNNRERQRRTAFARNLRRNYGITLQQYEEHLTAQGGVCATCGNGDTEIHYRSGKPRLLAVDHDHRTGQIRGLLCNNCNRALGLLKDDVELLRRMVDYLGGQ